jgi:hypothetical protein
VNSKSIIKTICQRALKEKQVGRKGELHVTRSSDLGLNVSHRQHCDMSSTGLSPHHGSPGRDENGLRFSQLQGKDAKSDRESLP